jgi:transposase-like protein
MTKPRREFAPEFKRETVALLESSGRPLSQVTTEIGIFAVDATRLAQGGAAAWRAQEQANRTGRRRT